MQRMGVLLVAGVALIMSAPALPTYCITHHAFDCCEATMIPHPPHPIHADHALEHGNTDASGSTFFLWSSHGAHGWVTRPNVLSLNPPARTTVTEALSRSDSCASPQKNALTVPQARGDRTLPTLLGRE